MTAYQIRDWEKHFENNKSRERDRCSFVCVPNKQDGLGLAYILSQKDGASIYGIWQLIIGAVSRQCRPRAGWLTSDGHQTGTAWAPRDMAMRWRRTEEEVQRALDVLSSPEVGWIIVPAECPPSAREVPAECPGKEGKGRERKGIETAATGSRPQTPQVDAAQNRPPTTPAAADLLKTITPLPVFAPTSKEAAIVRGLSMRQALEMFKNDPQVVEAIADSIPAGRVSAFLDEMVVAMKKPDIRDRRAYFMGSLKTYIANMDQDSRAALQRERRRATESLNKVEATSVAE